MGEEIKGTFGTLEKDIAIEDLKRDVAALRADLKKLMGMAGVTSKSKIDDAKSRLWQSAHDLEAKTEEQVREIYESVRHQGAKAVDLGRDQLEKRPLTTLLWSFGVGYVLARLVTRK